MVKEGERQILLNKAISIVSKLRNGYRELYKTKYLKFKPQLTTVEARSRLALIEGQKENKKEK